MKLSYAPYSLQFKHPFGLAYGSRTHTDVVFVKLELDGVIGYGEASLPPYLGETQASVIDFLQKAKNAVKFFNASFSIEEILKHIDKISPDNNAAKACIDIALHDLFGKYHNKPAYNLMQLQKPIAKQTSVTISIGELHLIPQKLEEVNDFTILKVKLGNKNDKQIIEAIREHTNKTMVVDVNQGWTDKHFALDMINYLSTKNVLFVEQPMPKENYDDMAWLTEHSPLPTIADESMKRLVDMDKLDGCFSGINLKLMKSTGLFEAAEIIKRAKQKNLKINVGCMSESSCAVSAAAQLMAYADWVDLDGPTLIKNNPFTGIMYNKGKVETSDLPGIGVELVNKDIHFN